MQCLCCSWYVLCGLLPMLHLLCDGAMRGWLRLIPRATAALWNLPLTALVLLRPCRVKAVAATIREAMLVLLRVEHTWPVASCRRMQT